jgi:hypothetical protein
MKSKSELLASLDAPMTNIRWSWGAVRPRDGAVFLLVWQDECKRVDKRLFVGLNTVAQSAETESLQGYQERVRHVEAIRNGARGYMLMCEAADLSTLPRTIKRVNDSEVFVGGELRLMDDDWWLESVARQPIETVR